MSFPPPPPPSNHVGHGSMVHPPPPRNGSSGQQVAASGSTARMSFPPPPPLPPTQNGSTGRQPATPSHSRYESSNRPCFPPPPPTPTSSAYPPPPSPTASSLHPPPPLPPNPLRVGPQQMNSNHHQINSHQARPPPTPTFATPVRPQRPPPPSPFHSHAPTPPPTFHQATPSTPSSRYPAMPSTSGFQHASLPPPPTPGYGQNGVSTPGMRPPAPPPPSSNRSRYPQYPPTPGPPPPPQPSQQPQQPFASNISNSNIRGPASADRPRVDRRSVPLPPLFTRPQNDDKTAAAAPVFYPRRALEDDTATTTGFSGRVVPPPADSRFVVQDDGNASPHLMRASLCSIPANRGQLRQSGLLEMGVMCTPLAIPSEDYVPPPRVLPEYDNDNGHVELLNEAFGGEAGDAQRIPVERNTFPPPRCKRCSAYANPFWGSDGTCNFCGYRNRDVQQPTQFGTMEYEVRGPYITRPKPVAPIFLYALDATCIDLLSYIPILERLGNEISSHWQRQPASSNNRKPRIGVVLFSSSGILLVCRKSADDPELYIMSDVSDPFCPRPLDDWTFELGNTESSQMWSQFCDNLVTLWKPLLDDKEKTDAYGSQGYASSCVGAALGFLADALAESGGRATILTWRRPNFGVGSITDRERQNLSRYRQEAEEHKLYSPIQTQKKLIPADQTASAFYKELGERCSRNRVSIHVVLHTIARPMSFLDCATFAELCRVTSGHLSWIRAPHWKEQMQQELLQVATSYHGFDAIFKVRCSDGIQVKSYFDETAPGILINGGIGSPELELTNVQPNTAIAVELEHRVGGLRENVKLAYIQSALLYTTPTGSRRVRVTTLALRKAASPKEVFLSVDFGSCLSLMSRHFVRQLRKNDEDATLRNARADMVEILCNILAAYRLHSGEAYAAPPGQLILPAKLQLLPLFCLSFIKSVLRPALASNNSRSQGSPSPTADERSYKFWLVSNSTPNCAMLLVHPNIYTLDKILTEEGVETGEGNWVIPHLPNNARSMMEVERTSHVPFVKLPQIVNPSIASLRDRQVYLIDDGTSIYCYVGREVPSNVRAQFIDADLDNGCSLDTKKSDWGKAIGRLVWQLRAFTSMEGMRGATIIARPTFPPFIVVISHGSHRDPFDNAVMKLMVNDAMAGERNYSEFLVAVHKLVRERVENGTIK